MEANEQESTVSQDRVDAGDMPRTVWSIGLAREVEVIGHAPDADSDVFLVSTDVDGDGSPDNAVRRFGSDLVPVFKEGEAVFMRVYDQRVQDETTTVAVVVTRSHRGLYVHTPLTLRPEWGARGAFLMEWASVREAVNEGTFGHSTSLEGEMVAALWRERMASSRSREEAVTEVDNLRAEHEAFKRTVVSTAKRYAIEHEWCGTVREALSDMGLEWGTDRFAVEVTVTGTITVAARDEAQARERALYLIDGFATSGGGGDWNPEDEMVNKETGDVEPVEE